MPRPPQQAEAACVVAHGGFAIPGPEVVSSEDRMHEHGRYRLRTWLRGHLPYVLSDRIPKGSGDCGSHEWYRVDDAWAECYYCLVGRRRLGPDEPLNPRTEAAPEVAGERDPAPA